MIEDPLGNQEVTTPYPTTTLSGRQADADGDGEVGEYKIIGILSGTYLFLLNVGDGSSTVTHHFELFDPRNGGSIKLDVRAPL